MNLQSINNQAAFSIHGLVINGGSFTDVQGDVNNYQLQTDPKQLAEQGAFMTNI
jgi:hypothetical protein